MPGARSASCCSLSFRYNFPEKKISLRFKNRLRRLSLLISRPIFKQLCFLFSASKEMFVQTMSRVSTFSKFSTLSICSKVLPREQSRNQLRQGGAWGWWHRTEVESLILIQIPRVWISVRLTIVIERTEHWDMSWSRETLVLIENRNQAGS